MFGTAKAVSGFHGRLPSGSARILRQAVASKSIASRGSTSPPKTHALQNGMQSQQQALRFPHHQGGQQQQRRSHATSCMSTQEDSNNTASSTATAVDAPPGTDDTRLHNKFLECVESKRASDAIELFARIVRTGGPLVTLRRRQLIVMLCGRGMVKEASLQLTGATVSDDFDSKDSATVAAFMHVINACIRHGETDRALKHFRQAADRGMTLDLPLCQDLASCFFREGLENVKEELRTWGWNVLEYVRQRGMFHGPEVCDKALLLAASRSNISFALEMCEYMEMSGLSPSRAVRRRLKDAVALITYGPEAGHADAEDLDAYLSAWDDDHDTSLEEENCYHEDDSDAEDIVFEVTDVRAESGGPMHDGIDMDVRGPVLDGDYYDEDASKPDVEDAAQRVAKPRRGGAATLTKDDVADYSDEEGNESFVLDEGKVTSSGGREASSPSKKPSKIGRPRTTTTTTTQSTKKATAARSPKIVPTTKARAAAKDAVPVTVVRRREAAVAAAAAAAAPPREGRCAHGEVVEDDIEENDDDDLEGLDEADMDPGLRQTEGVHDDDHDHKQELTQYRRRRQQQPRRLRRQQQQQRCQQDNNDKERPPRSKKSVPFVDWGGAEFVGDLAAQLSYLYPDKKPVSFEVDFYDEAQNYELGPYEKHHSGNRLGSSRYSWRRGDREGGEGDGGGERSSVGDRLDTVQVDVLVDAGDVEEGMDPAAATMAASYAQDALLALFNLRPQDEDDDDNDDDDDDE